MMFGVAVSYAWVLGFTAAFWVWRGKAEGMTLAKIYGWVTLASGIILFAKLADKQFGVVNVQTGMPGPPQQQQPSA